MVRAPPSAKKAPVPSGTRAFAPVVPPSFQVRVVRVLAVAAYAPRPAPCTRALSRRTHAPSAPHTCSVHAERHAATARRTCSFPPVNARQRSALLGAAARMRGPFARKSRGGLSSGRQQAACSRRPPSLRMRFRITLSRHRFSLCEIIAPNCNMRVFPCQPERRPIGCSWVFDIQRTDRVAFDDEDIQPLCPVNLAETGDHIRSARFKRGCGIGEGDFHQNRSVAAVGRCP
jgi:hypothetical protein